MCISVTTHVKHAQEIAAKLALDEYDAVVAMSGDGTIHEVVNGFAEHAESGKALRMPMAPIPGGSGNGMALNFIGVEVCVPLRFGRHVYS